MLLRLTILLLALLPAIVHADVQSRVVLPHVEVELVVGHESVKPGSESFVGLLFKLDPGWHVYWKNPGDSGEPPSVEWTLPDGVTVGEFRWPAPRRIVMGTIVTFGYEDEVLLSAPLRIADSFRGKNAEIHAAASWLVCEKVCIGQETDLRLTLPINQTSMKPTASARAKSLSELPRAPQAELRIIARRAGDRIFVAMASSAFPDGANLTFFPDEWNVLDLRAPQKVRRRSAAVIVKLMRSPERTEPVTRLTGVLVVEDGETRHAIAIDVPVTLDRRADEPEEPTGAFSIPVKVLIFLALAVAARLFRNWIRSRGLEEKA